MKEFLKKYASPLSVAGFLLFLCGLIYRIFDYGSDQDWGVLALAALWIPAVAFIVAGLIVRRIFKKKKTQLIIDTLVLLTLIVIIALSYG